MNIYIKCLRKTFFENPEDPTILLRLPMTKAAVRAMDAITEFSSKFGAKVDKFMVAGASKVILKVTFYILTFDILNNNNSERMDHLDNCRCR